jgi:parallel beta-helix repeat protein
VAGSYIHHCQLGVGSWAVDDVGWTNNEVATNTIYGFDANNEGQQASLAANNVHDNAFITSFRWSSSNQRLYVTGPGSGTLTQLKEALPSAPLTLVDPVNKIWHVEADLYVENGGQLKLHGPAAGGDVAELRLKSENTGATNAIVELRADYGWLDIRDTKIISWDSATNGPDTEVNTYGRAFIRARSSLAADGVTPRPSRMDVVNSEIGYLGSAASEAYGLVWRVIPTTATNLPPGQTVYDLVDVEGDIRNSHLHHNYHGLHASGHFGGLWANNEINHNIGYGIAADDDADGLVIENNNVHHNGLHGIFASDRCDHGILRTNQSWANGQNGIMLHRTANDWLVEGNQSRQNSDSGIALFASMRAVIRNNLCLSNSNTGMRFSVGASDNIVTNNTLNWSGTNALRIYQDDDTPNPGDDGRPRRNLFAHNILTQYGADAVKVEHGDENTFTANTCSAGIQTTLRFDEATNNLVTGNFLPGNSIIKSTGTAPAPAFTTIKQQPQLILVLDFFSTATFRDEAGAIFDFSQPQVFTPVGPTGSVASITRTNIGSAAIVILRNLFVGLDAGSAEVVPTGWNTSGMQTKSWTSRLLPGTPVVSYTVGDLTPGSTHAVAIGTPGVPLGSFIANPLGRITFLHNNATPAFGATNSFTVVLEKENTAPALPAQDNRTIGALTLLTVTNTASDNDIPPEPLFYSLAVSNLGSNTAITNASIDSDGVITWTPTNDQAASTNRFTTIVSDGYLNATNSFLVTVDPPVVFPVALTISPTATNTAVLLWPAAPAAWTLQENDTPDTANWADATNAVSVIGDLKQVIIPPESGTKFYRLIHP